MSKYKVKSLYTVYIQYKFLGENVSSLVQFEWTLNQKKVLCAKKKTNISETEGDREANSQDHKKLSGVTVIGEVYHIDSMSNCLLEAMPFTLVIL